MAGARQVRRLRGAGGCTCGSGKTRDFEIALNVVIVRLGRNVMSVSQGGLSADAVALEQATRAGFAKLAAATA